MAVTLLLLWTALFTHTDAAGDGMAQGFAVLAVICFFVSAVPAFLLAWFRKALTLALIWSILPLVFIFVLLS